MEKLYKKLEAYSKQDYYPFHMPGHKRNPFSADGDFPFDRDITEIHGFDNLHHAVGVLREAEAAVSRLYGTKESFYSVNGSTAAILAAVSAAVKRGGEILVARNCHKSVYNALYLRDITPAYVYPRRNSGFGLNGGVSPERVRRCLEENPRIEAVLITSPTYDGVVSDVKQIAEAAHSYGIPLIVDEAHGAHFRFSDYFPVSAAELGADVVIQSFHKTLPSMTQTAVLHRCSDMVERRRLMQFLEIYQTSSPSYILMASMDACVDKLSRDGAEMYREYTENLDKTRNRLEGLKYIRLVTPKKDDERKIFDYDRSRLVLSTAYSSLSGKQLYGILNEKYHLEMEMQAENYVLALTSVGDTEEGFERLCTAIEEIDAAESFKITEEKEDFPDERHWDRMKQVLRISQAVEAPAAACRLEESVGKISAEFAYLYPPGIPLVVPGEQITGHLVRNMRRYMDEGLELQGLADNTNETIFVVKE